MLRITPKSQTDREVVLAVDGTVTGRAVALLEQEIRRQLRHTTRLVLVLDGLQFVDEAGVALLQQWVEQNVVLRGGSVFLRALLGAEGLVPD